MTMFRSISVLLFSLVLGGQAVAAGGGDEKEGNNRTVELPGLVVPVASEDGRLINYLFVSARLHIAQGHDHWKYREQGHIIRDRILKQAHREAFTSDDNPMKIDPERATAEIEAALADVLDEGAIDSVEFIAVDSLKLFPDS